QPGSGVACDGAGRGFNRDPAATEFVGNGGRRARAGVAIEHDVTRVAANGDDPLQQALRLRRRERLDVGEQLAQVVALRLLVTADFVVRPPGTGNDTVRDVREIRLDDWQGVAVLAEPDPPLSNRLLERLRRE